MLSQRPSITTILMSIGLLLLVMPIGGIYFLRIYESALIRQTESELISQAAFISSLYKKEVALSLKKHKIALDDYGLLSSQKKTSHSSLQPIPAHLDLARDFIYPAKPSPLYTQDHLDTIADEAGKQVITVLPDVQRVTLSGIQVLDYQGLVAVGHGERGLSFAHIKEFQQAKTGSSVSLLRQRRMPKTMASLKSASRNSNINVFVALPITLGDRLIGIAWVNRTPTDLMQALYGKRQEIIWLTLLVAVIATVITSLTAYAITRPIRALVEKTRQIAKNTPAGQEVLDHPVTVEVAELSENLASMARILKHRNEYIRDFARHVSHEFKTPLSSIQGSIELIQDNLDEMPREQKKRFLSNMALDTERLSQLVTHLLELARADMSEPVFEKTDLSTILQDLIVRYQAKELTIQITAPRELPSVRMTAESLEAVVSNVLENSWQAGANQVEIAVSSEKALALLRVQDNGPGISAENQESIFTPFFTTRRGDGGSGLGLCITQSLLERQNGSIRLVPDTVGACFEIQIPVA